MAQLTYGFGFTSDARVRLHQHVQVLSSFRPQDMVGPYVLIQQLQSAPEHQRGSHLTRLRAFGAIKERAVGFKNPTVE